MGYTTDFDGVFKLNKPLDDETYSFLKKLSETRRMKRVLPSKYGVDGEFYVDGKGLMGSEEKDPSIVNYNMPPSTQPSLWCQWTPTEDRLGIHWDGNEKFYDYVPWIIYIIDKILAPRGYSLTGDVVWVGEDRDDMGKIEIKNNRVKVKQGKVMYE